MRHAYGSIGSSLGDYPHPTAWSPHLRELVDEGVAGAVAEIERADATGGVDDRGRGNGRDAARVGDRAPAGRVEAEDLAVGAQAVEGPGLAGAGRAVGAVEVDDARAGALEAGAQVGGDGPVDQRGGLASRPGSDEQRAGDDDRDQGPRDQEAVGHPGPRLPNPGAAAPSQQK